MLLPSPTTQWGANVTAAVADWRTRSETTNLPTADPFIATPQRALEAPEGLWRSPQPDAIVAFQQGLAPSLLHWLDTQRLSAPEDVLLAVGVDGRDAEATSITAIDLDPAGTGHAAVELALRSDPQPLRARVVVRGSTRRKSPAG